MATTFNVFSLGVAADMDTSEGNDTAENASALVGSTFGGTGNPLYAQVKSFSPGTGGFSGGTSTAYDQNNSTANEKFKIDGGSDQTFDSISTYNATITYADGTTASITAVVFQDTAGNTYLGPEFSSNSDQTALEAKPVTSLTLNSLESNTYAGLSGDRQSGNYITPDGTVDGTSGDDSIDTGFIDAQGDARDGFDGDNDDILSGAGNDTINSGAGDDTIDGGTGNDSITGGSGADSLIGGVGADTIIGSDGDDFINGGAGNDSLMGGTGNDTIWTGSGLDTIDGGDGDDVISANTDDATIQGGAGDDTISATGGDDLVDGGDDRDSFIVNDGFGNDTITGGEGVTTGSDDDTIDLSRLTTGVTVDGTGSEAGTIVNGGDTITYSQIEGLTLTDQADVVDSSADSSGLTIDAGDGNDSILAGNGDDSLIGGAGNDTLWGRGGDDTVRGGDGNDYLGPDGGEVYGDAGDDTLWGYSADHIDGGSGEDWLWTTNSAANFTIDLSELGAQDFGGGISTTVTGIENIYTGVGDDSLRGDGGANTVFAGDGADTIAGGGGADNLSGGDDADRFIIEDSFGNDTIVGGEGGTDSDTIDLSALSGGVTVTHTDSEDGTISDGSDTITFSEVENIFLTAFDDSVDGSADTLGMNIFADDGNDSITGGTGADTISGGDGDDLIDGGDGDDFLTTGLGNDTLIGGDGNDTLLNSDGDDSLVGGAGNDSIVATGGDDTLEGGAGDDTLDGGADNDSITGGTGDDSITGGTGDDTFTYSVGDGHDTIADFNTGNTGTLSDGDSTNNDFIDLSGFYDNLSELYADQADDGILNQSNATDAKGRSTDYSDNSEFGASDSLTFQGASADNSSFTQENTGVVCFTAGTAIHTPRGDVLIDDLKVGDLVSTMDNGPQPIRWIGKRHIGGRALATEPKLRPILIPRGVFGAERNLLVSRQHALLINQDILARAAHLTDTDGLPIRVANGKRQVTYIHLMFDAHEIIFAEQVASESFYPGPMAFAMFEDETRRQFMRAFPEFSGLENRDQVTDVYGNTSRVIAKRRNVAKLMTGVEELR